MKDDDDILFHQERERQCRDMAEQSSDEDVRRIHQKLAALHARYARNASSTQSKDR